MDYNEQQMIAFTIVRYFPQLMTRFERDIALAFFARGKAVGSGKPEVEERLRTRMGTEGDPGIDQILNEGYEKFRMQVADRVMRESPDQVILNRCPECNRVVGTPMAKWCKWCKFDWH